MRNATRRHRPTPYLLVGGLCGLTWAAGLRGWMAQLVWPASSYTWLTVVLIMLPGLVIGLLVGWAAYARSLGIRSSRWLVFTPALFAVALLDPEIFRSLISDGQGGGALIVVFTPHLPAASRFRGAGGRRGWALGSLRCLACCCSAP